MQGRKIEEINGKDVLSLVWFLRVKEISSINITNGDRYVF